MNEDQTVLRHELKTILAIRLTLLTVLLVSVVLIRPAVYIAFYIFMAVGFSITIPYSFWLRKSQVEPATPLWLIMMDLLVITGLICSAGYFNIDLTLLYLLLILEAAVLLTPKQTINLALFSIIISLLLAICSSNAIIPGYAIKKYPSKWREIYPALVFRTMILGFFGLAGHYFSRCCINCRQEHKFRRMTETIIRNTPVGLLLLDPDDRVLIANDTACTLLNQKKEDIIGRVCTALVANKVQGTTATEESGGDIPGKQLNRNSMPIAYHRETISLPAFLFPCLERKTGDVPVTIYVLKDISHIIKMKNEFGKIQQIAITSKIAGEMAHEIRTPLTAITASVQLLQHYNKYTGKQENQTGDMWAKEKKELFEHIINASDRLNTVIQRFCDFSEYSLDDLISIIKLDTTDEDSGYINQINSSRK